MSRNLPAATCSSMNLTNRPYSDMLTKPRISCSAGSVMSGLSAEVPERTGTRRLSDLNRRYMPDVTTQERSACAAFVDSVVARDEHEKALLQAAHELRLVLPKYLADHGAASP